MAYNQTEYPIVVSLTFNDIAFDASILQKREDLFSIDTTIYNFSIKNIGNTYWETAFGGSYVTFNNAGITITIAGIILNRVYETDALVNSSNTFLVINETVYVNIDYSNTNSRIAVGFQSGDSRLNFINAITNYINPSDTEIDGIPAYPILNISSINNNIGNNVGGIAFINNVNFAVSNYAKSSIGYGGFNNLKQAVGSNLYNSVVEIFINENYVNKIDEMKLLFKGFVSNFFYDINEYNFTISDFRTSFSDVFCSNFSINDYYVQNAVYEEDLDIFVPYLWGARNVELIKIAIIENINTTFHYYIAIDKECNANPFDLTKVFDRDENIIDANTLYLEKPYILRWTENTTPNIPIEQTEPYSAFVKGNNNNKILDIIKQLFIFQKWNWNETIDLVKYHSIYDFSPRINLLIDEDKTTKEILTTVCETDQLYIFT